MTDKKRYIIIDPCYIMTDKDWLATCKKDDPDKAVIEHFKKISSEVYLSRTDDGRYNVQLTQQALDRGGQVAGYEHDIDSGTRVIVEANVEVGKLLLSCDSMFEGIEIPDDMAVEEAIAGYRSLITPRDYMAEDY